MKWIPVAVAFRVQQTGWRDVKEYMETYGPPERWDNGFIRCTRVKSNGYYTYWYETTRTACASLEAFDLSLSLDLTYGRRAKQQANVPRVR
jgi:hypothetical protein